jgi:His-Xaa-Ser system protein HxsD
MDGKIYSFEAVKAAAVTYSNRARVVAEKRGRRIRVELAAPGTGAERELRGGFFNEVLHHVLRLDTARRNKGAVELIVARALLSAQPEIRLSGK